MQAQVSDEGAPARRRLRRLGIAGSVAAGVLGAAALAAAFVELPYVLVSPGTATPVDGVVEVDGARTYEHDGTVLFLTVSVSDPNDGPNAYMVLSGWLDDEVDVIPEDEFLGGRDPAEEERLNELAMTNSQLSAKKVSLERLGYTVPIEGTGVIVTSVQKRSPARSKLKAGDVVTAVDGTPVALADDVGPLVRSRAPGEPVAFTLERGKATKTVSVPTRAAPDGPFEGQAQVGVTTATRDLEFDFPVDVTIDTGEVGGPSAGLAFTLTILDELSPGDLTGGKKVAVTGTIELDGTVGPVGGVEQKAVAASRAGAELFLVPAEEAQDARGRAGRLEVVGVDDLDDALAALGDAGGDPLPPPPAT